MGDGDLLPELRGPPARVVAEQPGAAPDADQRQQRQARRDGPRARTERWRCPRESASGGTSAMLRPPVTSARSAAAATAASPDSTGRIGLGVSASAQWRPRAGHRDVLTGGALGTDQPGDLVGRRPGVPAVAVSRVLWVRSLVFVNQPVDHVEGEPRDQQRHRDQQAGKEDFHACQPSPRPRGRPVCRTSTCGRPARSSCSTRGDD